MSRTTKVPEAIQKRLDDIRAAPALDPAVVKQREQAARRGFIRQGLRAANVEVEEILVPNSDGDVTVEVLIDPADVELEEDDLTLSDLTLNDVKLANPKLKLRGRPSVGSKKVAATLRGSITGRARAALVSPAVTLTATLSNNSALTGFKIRT